MVEYQQVLKCCRFTAFCAHDRRPNVMRRSGRRNAVLKQPGQDLNPDVMDPWSGLGLKSHCKKSSLLQVLKIQNALFEFIEKPELI